MNKTFKTVWNRVRRAYVAVNETVSSTAQSSGSTLPGHVISLTQPHPSAGSELLRKKLLAVYVGLAFSISLSPTIAQAAYNLTVEQGQEITITEPTLNVAQGAETGIITNKGKLTIQGNDTPSAQETGIRTLALDGGHGEIINEDNALLYILGNDSVQYGIRQVSSGAGSNALITNRGAGDIVIQAGGGSQAHGIMYFARDGGYARIENSGSGNVYINGKDEWFEGSTGAAGIQTFSTGEGSQGIISNTGSGTIFIQAHSFHAINALATDGGSATISNEGNGTITIQAANEVSGDAINRFGSATLINGINGTLNIFGTRGSYDRYGIRSMTGSARIENSGTMNLNATGIGNFNTADVLITNKSTGRVNAAAEAIFVSGDYEVSNVSKDITVITSGNSQTVTTDNFGSTVITGDGWNLKDDWRNHSVWEDGGSLTVTDIADNTYDAQLIRDAFESQFGTGTSLTFTGQGGTAVSGDMYDTLTIAVVNQLISEGKVVDGSVITSELFDSEGNAFSLGTGGTLDMSIGFKGIDNAASVAIDGGRTLTLTGDTVASASDFDLAGGAAVSVVNGTLQLGLDALENAVQYKGSLSKVDIGENGTLNIVAGEFEISGDNSLTSAGTISNSGTLSIMGTEGNLSGTAIKNEAGAEMLITGGSGYAAYGIDNVVSGTGSSGTIDNLGTMTISGGPGSDAAGINSIASNGATVQITNNEGASLALTGSSIGHNNGINTLAESGSTAKIINNQGASLSFSGGTYADAYGLQYLASGVGSTGTIENSGTVTIGGGSWQAIGSLAANGGTGRIINNSGAELTIAGGSSSGLGVLATGNGSLGIIENSGTVKISGGSETSAVGLSSLAGGDATGQIITTQERYFLSLAAPNSTPTACHRSAGKSSTAKAPN